MTVFGSQPALWRSGGATSWRHKSCFVTCKICRLSSTMSRVHGGVFVCLGKSWEFSMVHVLVTFTTTSHVLSS